MARQLLPVLLQSSHCTVSVGVGVPVQAPWLRVSVCPTVAVPVIDGGVWLAGGVVGAVTVAAGVVGGGVGSDGAGGAPGVGEGGGGWRGGGGGGCARLRAAGGGRGEVAG